MAPNLPQPKRRQSIRLAGFDYRAAGYYFVTVCVKGGEPCLGEVRTGRVLLTSIGEVVAACVHAIPDHAPNATLDECIIMPNHLHCIVQLRVDVAYEAKIHPSERFANPVSGSLPTIVRTFKAAVTREARRLSLPWPGWHRGYYERIVRTSGELERIRWYIQSNPVRWK